MIFFLNTGKISSLPKIFKNYDISSSENYEYTTENFVCTRNFVRTLNPILSQGTFEIIK